MKICNCIYEIRNIWRFLSHSSYWVCLPKHWSRMNPQQWQVLYLLVWLWARLSLIKVAYFQSLSGKERCWGRELDSPSHISWPRICEVLTLYSPGTIFALKLLSPEIIVIINNNYLHQELNVWKNKRKHNKVELKIVYRSKLLKQYENYKLNKFISL